MKVVEWLSCVNIYKLSLSLVHKIKRKEEKTLKGFVFILRCLLFRRWLCGKAASDLESILCGVLLKELQKVMKRSTDRRDIPEITLKTALNTIHSIFIPNRIRQHLHRKRTALNN